MCVVTMERNNGSDVVKLQKKTSSDSDEEKKLPKVLNEGLMEKTDLWWQKRQAAGLI